MAKLTCTGRRVDCRVQEQLIVKLVAFETQNMIKS